LKKNDLIYIAGHKGLIGSALHRKLKERGYLNIITKTRHELDLENLKKVSTFLNKYKPRYIFIAAGITGGIQENIKNPYKLMIQNINIQNNIIQSAMIKEVKKVIYYGSSCMYPAKIKTTLKETDLLTSYPERTSLHYAISKLAGLHLCHAANIEYKSSKFITLIPNNVFGINDDFNLQTGHVLASLIKKFHNAKINNERSLKLWGDGLSKREFIYSDDIADASIYLINKKIQFTDLPINIGTNNEYSIKVLAEKIKKLTNYEGLIKWDKTKPSGVRRKILSTNRLSKYGWKTSRNFDEDLKNTYQWFLKNEKKTKH